MRNVRGDGPLVVESRRDAIPTPCCEGCPVANTEVVQIADPSDYSSRPAHIAIGAVLGENNGLLDNHRRPPPNVSPMSGDMIRRGGMSILILDSARNRHDVTNEEILYGLDNPLEHLLAFVAQRYRATTVKWLVIARLADSDYSGQMLELGYDEKYDRTWRRVFHARKLEKNEWKAILESRRRTRD